MKAAYRYLVQFDIASLFTVSLVYTDRVNQNNWRQEINKVNYTRLSDCVTTLS